MANSTCFKDITVVQSFFSQEGRYPGYRHTQRAEIHLGTLLVKGERKGERSGYRQDPSISVSHRKERDLVQAAHRHNPYGKRDRDTTGGQYPGYRHTQRAEIHLGTLLVKGERKGERSGYRQDPSISVSHRKERDLVQAAHRHNPYGKRDRDTTGGQDPVSGASRDLTPAGRDPHPRGRQPGHQGERASVKETSRTQRLQPVH